MDGKDKKIEELEYALSDIRSRYRKLKSYRKSEYDNQLKNRLLKKTKALEEAEAKIATMLEIDYNLSKMLVATYRAAESNEDNYYDIGYIDGIQNALFLFNILDIDDLIK